MNESDLLFFAFFASYAALNRFEVFLNEYHL